MSDGRRNYDRCGLLAGTPPAGRIRNQRETQTRRSGRQHPLGASSPEVDPCAFRRGSDDFGRKCAGPNHGEALAHEVGCGQSAVRVSAETLQVFVPDSFGVPKDPLAETAQQPVTGSRRCKELLELGLNLGFADQWRPESADDLEQERVGLGVGQDPALERNPVAWQEVNLAQTGPPGRRIGRGWS